MNFLFSVNQKVQFHNQYGCIVLINCADPDQLASSEASGSGSTLFFIEGLEVRKTCAQCAHIR